MSRVSRAIRWGIAGGCAVAMWYSWKIFDGILGGAGMLATVILGVFIGVMIAPDVARLAAHLFIGGIMGETEKFTRPQQMYGPARTLVARGRYAEAIEAYRRILAEFPGDVVAQAAIADIAFDKLKDRARALEELNVLIGFKLDEATRSTTLMRLADLYEQDFNSPAYAADCLAEIVEEYPQSRFAPAAAERLAQLKARHPQLQPTRHDPRRNR